MASWKSLMHKWRCFTALAPRDRHLFLRAAGGLLLVAIARRLTTFKRLRNTVDHLLPLATVYSDSSHDVLPDAYHVASIVAIATRNVPISTTCLERSVVLWGLLRQRGIQSELRFGTRQQNGQFEAHAWIEYQGVILNDADDIGQYFTPFEQNLDTV